MTTDAATEHAPPEETQNDPGFGKSELSAFGALLGLSITLFFELDLLEIWWRIGILVAIPVFGVSILAAAEPSFNKLVVWLAHPHRLPEILRDLRAGTSRSHMQRQHIWRWVGVFVVFGVSLFLLANWLNNTLEQQLRDEQSRGIAEAALEPELDVDLALLTALEANRVAPTAEARWALAELLLENRHLDQVIPVEGADRIVDLDPIPNSDNFLIGSANGLVVEWNLGVGKVREIETSRALVEIAVSSDGQLIATGHPGEIRFWDRATGGEVGRPLQSVIPEVPALEFSPKEDSNLLAYASASGAIGGTSGLFIIDAATRQTGSNDTLRGLSGRVEQLQWSEDGSSIAARSDNDELAVWPIVGDPTQLTPDPLEKVKTCGAVTWSPPLDLVIYNPSARFTVRAPGVPESASAQACPNASEIRDTSSTVSETGDLHNVITVERSGSLTLWDLSTETHTSVLLGRHPDVEAATYTTNGNRIVTGGADGRIRVWNPGLSEGITPASTSLDTSVRSIALSGDETNLVYVGGADGRLMMWETSEKLVTSVMAHQGRIQGLAYSDDEQKLVSGGGDGVVSLWPPDIQATTSAEASTEPGSPITVMAISVQGDRVAVGREDGTVEVIRVRDLGRVTSTNLDGAVRSLSFHPSRTTIAAGTSAGTIHFIDSGTGLERRNMLEGFHEQVTTLVYVDEDRLVTGGIEGRLNLWDLNQSDVPARLPLRCLPPGSIQDVNCNVVTGAINDQRSLLAVSSGSNAVQLWDIGPEDLTPLEQPVLVHTQAVTALAFGSGGRILATGSADATAVELELEFQRLVELACSLAARNMSAEEWALVTGDSSGYVLHCELAESGPGAPVDAPAAEY